jgi:hypothetical protein
MKSHKKFYFLLAAFLLTLSTTKIAKADLSDNGQENNFSKDVDITYEVQDSLKTMVTYNFSLENNASDLYATTFSLSLKGINPINPQGLESGTKLEIAQEENANNHILKVSFPDKVVGKGNKRKFTITYEDRDLAVKTGEVKEISIPKVADENNFRDINVYLSVPQNWKDEAYISPKPIEKSTNSEKIIYYFDKNSLAKSGVSAAFGKFQVFKFDLTYHLNNPSNNSSVTTVAIPPDTEFQKVIYQSIDPSPSQVTVDQDGNWLAEFNLIPHARIDVRVTGSVQIFPDPLRKTILTSQDIYNNLKESRYWQTQDEKIRDLASKLKTAKDIYNYVSSKLKYDYPRVRPNAERLGAVKALENPSLAICMEYTDLFIAIARAAGIPSREVNGFAYTENPEIEPLSLVSDILHSWVEYYDFQKEVWVPIDPTWGSTTGGTDFFSKLDLRHFTFVIHGKDSSYPYPAGSYKLGNNPQKDVLVQFATLPESRVAVPRISFEKSKTYSFQAPKVKVLINNPGPVALYSQKVDINLDNQNVIKDYNIDLIPPYGSRAIQIEIPYGILGSKIPETIAVSIDKIKQVEPLPKSKIMIENAIIIFVAMILLGGTIYVKVKRSKRTA